MSSPVTRCLTSLSSSKCSQQFDPSQNQTSYSDCQFPLLTSYDLQTVQKNISRNCVRNWEEQGVWQWHELVPVRDPLHWISLGKGNTPLLPNPHIAKSSALEDFSIKNESHNTPGTFKAREPGLTNLVVPAAGKQEGALAAYAARSGLTAHIYISWGAPLPNQQEVRQTGAEWTPVPGLISDTNQKAAREAADSHPPENYLCSLIPGVG